MATKKNAPTTHNHNEDTSSATLPKRKLQFRSSAAQRAYEAIAARAGQTLVVYFERRTPGVGPRGDRQPAGSVRRMLCSYHPAEASKAQYGFNPVAKGLLPVWDGERGETRFISLGGVRRIRHDGDEVYTSIENVLETPEEKDQRRRDFFERFYPEDAQPATAEARSRRMSELTDELF